MSDQSLSLSLYEEHRRLQDKYDYFLMAMSGAAIALAIHRTETSRLEWSHAWLGSAVVAWGLSIWAGCRRQQLLDQLTRANIEMINAKSGISDVSGTNLRAAVEVVNQCYTHSVRFGNQARRCHLWQFRLLACGVGFFLVWHVKEMATVPRVPPSFTPPTACP